MLAITSNYLHVMLSHSDAEVWWRSIMQTDNCIYVFSIDFLVPWDLVELF